MPRSSASSSSEASSVVALRVEVDDRLVRVGQHLRPAALVEDLDPVEQVDLAVLQPLGEDAHDECPSAPTGTASCRWTSVGAGSSATSSESGRSTGASSSSSLQRLATAS